MKYKNWNYIVCFCLLVATCNLACAQKSIEKLDFNLYLSLADLNVIYPSTSQIELLSQIIPGTNFQPAPSIKNRTYWDNIAATKSGKAYLENAISEMSKAPEVPISDEIYRRANKEGNRKIYKPRYYRTMERLEHFMLAECIENQGRFLPQINTYIQAILSMKSWLHPNHDDDKNGVLEGRRISIDLGARRFGSDLALAEVLLRDKLASNLRDEIANHLQQRIINSYLTTCKKPDGNNKWITSTSNWNSVCTSGSTFTAMAVAKTQADRIAAVGSALNSMKHYLSGFGNDGYCSEGAGYWNYGFGHYLYLAQILYDYTDGAIDLFEADNPTKLKNVGNFPQRFQIHNGICAPFSDGVSKVANDGGFAYTLAEKHFGLVMPKGYENYKSHDSYSAAFQLIDWNFAKSTKHKDGISTAEELPNYTYFDDFGIVISRGKQDLPLSIAIKSGHNAENHNHSDVGAYTIVLNKDIVTGDIGAPSYIAGAFSPDNPARSSWGHPVPRIDNTLQANGKAFAGTITETVFTENVDKVVMDIKPAYDIPALNSLKRTMTNDRSGNGAITIEDSFSSTKPVAFGTAIMTLGEYEIVDDHTVILKSKNQILKTEISGNGHAIKIKDELVPVKHLREGAPAYRIGIDFVEPLSAGAISVKYTPLDNR